MVFCHRGGAPSPDWKPSYGVYFDSSTNIANDPDPEYSKYNLNQEFIYFADTFTVNGSYDAGEELSRIRISKGDFVSSINKCDDNGCSSDQMSLLSISFRRPDPSAIFNGSTSLITSAEYIQITISSPTRKATGFIKIYPAGRIEVK